MQEGIIPPSHQLEELCVAGRNYRGGMPPLAIIPSIDPAQIFALHGAGGVSAMSLENRTLASKPRSRLATFPDGLENVFENQQWPHVDNFGRWSRT